MGCRQGQPKTTVAVLKDTYGKCKLYVTGDINDYKSMIYNKNPRLEAVWEKIVARCSTEGIDGRAYVEWCFQKEYPHYPMPSKFSHEGKFQSYLEAGCPDIHFAQAKLLFELQLTRLNKIEPGQDVVEYLLDPLNAFTSIFVYTIISNLNRLDALPPAILEQAARQAFCQPVYSAKLNDIIPQEVFIYGHR